MIAPNIYEVMDTRIIALVVVAIIALVVWWTYAGSKAGSARKPLPSIPVKSIIIGNIDAGPANEQAWTKIANGLSITTNDGPIALGPINYQASVFTVNSAQRMQHIVTIRYAQPIIIRGIAVGVAAPPGTSINLLRADGSSVYAAPLQ